MSSSFSKPKSRWLSFKFKIKSLDVTSSSHSVSWSESSQIERYHDSGWDNVAYFSKCSDSWIANIGFSYTSFLYCNRFLSCVTILCRESSFYKIYPMLTMNRLLRRKLLVPQFYHLEPKHFRNEVELYSTFSSKRQPRPILHVPATDHVYHLQNPANIY